MTYRLCPAVAISLCLALAVTACGGGNQPAQQTSTPAQGGSAPPAAAATDKPDGPGVITGMMTFEGTPPPPRKLQMESDPQCVGESTSEALLVGKGGGLRNVFVFVKEGLGQRRYAAPTEPVSLDQKGCRYIPHVFGAQVGQALRITNSDPAVHNVHATPKTNAEFNFGQVPGVPAATKTFDKPEVMVPIRCDVHNWMIAYAGVVEHPFFAVTKEDGSFEIKGLPPGTYTIGAWHEQLGERTQSVTVDAAAPAKVNLAFKPQT